MATLSSDDIRRRLEPYTAPFGTAIELPDPLIRQISDYLDLLIRWNSRVSLTAIRRPEEIVERHFGESLFTACDLATKLAPTASLLDYGTGPGFPGLPIQMALPSLRVTVAESQAKKAAFLREVIRTLNLPAEVWPGRVEEMPESRRFDALTLRAVEKMEISIQNASKRVREGGWIAALIGDRIDLPDAEDFAIPNSERRRLALRRNVPRGTSMV